MDVQHGMPYPPHHSPLHTTCFTRAPCGFLIWRGIVRTPRAVYGSSYVLSSPDALHSSGASREGVRRIFDSERLLDAVLYKNELCSTLGHVYDPFTTIVCVARRPAFLPAITDVLFAYAHRCHQIHRRLRAHNVPHRRAHRPPLLRVVHSRPPKPSLRHGCANHQRRSRSGGWRTLWPRRSM